MMGNEVFTRLPQPEDELEQNTARSGECRLTGPAEKNRPSFGQSGFSSRTSPSEQHLFPRLKICLLDQDSERLNSLARILTTMGYDVLSLNHVIGASSRIRRFQPDLLVLDVNMPTLSGLKLIEVLRQNLNPLPLLILYSDMEEAALAHLAEEAAADDFVPKEEYFTALISRIRYHLERLRRAQQR